MSAGANAGEVLAKPGKAGGPCAMVIFGASGDLTMRKLIPSLFNLAKAGLLPKDFVVVGAAHDDLSEDQFRTQVRLWIDSARDHRWKQPYTDLTYQPMTEVLNFMRANGYKTYIVTGGGQDFVRVYADKVYGIPPEQVVGTAGGTKFEYGENGEPFLLKDPKLLLNDNNAGKAEGIHFMIAR